MAKKSSFIARRRRELGKTQEDLAKEVKVSRRTVQYWEAGGTVKITNLEPLAKALQVSTKTLVREESK